MINSTDDPIVVVGMGVRLPGADAGIEQYERLLFDGESAVGPLESSRFDHDFYFDRKRGVAGKTYTKLGSCVRADAAGQHRAAIESLGTFDLAHQHFAEVAADCWESSGAAAHPTLAQRCGIFVGHSGGTELGGALAMATLAETVAEQLRSIDAFQNLSHACQQRVIAGLTDTLRQGRPQRREDTIHFNAYSAASLAARLLNLGGTREVIDAACASSLLALQHALLSLRHGRMDAAIVGGATFNNVDNLILFSQSQACSEVGSCPFDEAASGLVSSEGYVAIAIMRRSLATQHGLAIQGIIRAVGVASDGRGKSLWAPRTEGQQLAVRRAYPDGKLLSIDYQEAHATSTQVGDATELNSLQTLLNESSRRSPLLVGSVKSNLGHTLEAAGLVGLVKVLLSMRRGVIAPTINLTQPTTHFDWSAGALRVADRQTTWPTSEAPRRAAVNAFGIGGLNAHAVIEQFVPGDNHGSVVTPMIAKREPLAIVGRGVVVAGAANVDEFRDLLRSDRTALGPAPADRWLREVGINASNRPQTFTAATNHGAYIRDYRFNGQQYRIPPKQVRLANPAQMMLIDAVAQACGEFDGGQWNINRQRTGIVIGTIFGGEFSNQLQVGLRLPEIAERLATQLRHAAVDGATAAQVLTDYQQRLLDQYSALLDETGSFTASTLASRIAKTFDLMGGACAVDADDASSGLALMLAADQLQSGTLDVVICGVAQRSLDLVAFEQLDLKNQLVRSGRASDIPTDLSRVLPGEGVAAVMLMRLSDARREGRPILGVIDHIDCGTTNDRDAMRSRSLAESPMNHRVASRVGYLAGAHGLLRMIAETVVADQTLPTCEVASVAEDGFFVKVSMTDPTNVSLKTSPASKFDLMLTLRFEADSEAEFEVLLKTVSQSPDRYVDRGEFRQSSVHRAVTFGHDLAQLREGLAAIADAWNAGTRIEAMPRQRALLWDARCGRDRIGWVFPGQGSQYPAVPQVITEDPLAAEYLSDLDRCLRRLGHAAVTPQLADPDRRLGRDVWWTQQWVLAVSSVLADSLRRRGHAPDVVLGHSFGECGAALDAGVMTLVQAIRFAKLRSDAVVMTVRGSGQLLSVRAEPSQVRAVLSRHQLDCYITHQNAPNQTVIAGDASAIEVAKRSFSQDGYASVVIPVPAAFHTPLMADAQRVLASGFGHETLRPPRHAFLSATSTSYLAEPQGIRSALIEQLTHPVLYASSVRRMVDDGCGLLIEVGPSDVLTRLNQATVAGDALCYSLDSNHGTHAERLLWIDLAAECVSGQSLAQRGISSKRATVAVATSVTAPRPTLGPANDIEMFDVTSRARRAASKGAVAKPATASAEPPVVNAKPIAIAPPAAIPAVASQMNVDLAKQFLVDIVVELTGYEPDVIDFEADLEAELGVDSIKKAQVIGELAEWASLELDLREMKLADFNSLGDILSLIGIDTTQVPQPAIAVAQPIARAASVKPVSPGALAKPVSQPPVAVQPVTPLARQTSASLSLAKSIESLMVDFVVDQTGYDPDVIDLDADLESELGIDSIKKAQLLGELAEQYELHDVELGRLSLADFLNLRSILEFVLNHSDASTEIEDHSAELVKATAAGEAFDHDDDFARGQQIGSSKKNGIRNRLRDRVDGVAEVDAAWLNSLLYEPSTSNGHSVTTVVPPKRLIEGLARGAGVHPLSLEPMSLAPAVVSQPDAIELEVPSHGTCRFTLHTVQRNRRAGTPAAPTFTGDALVIGDNEFAVALKRRLEQHGVKVHAIKRVTDAAQADQLLASVWSHVETPHLFLTTPHDSDSLRSLDARAWETRRGAALTGVFRVCQQWMQRMIDGEMMNRASLVTTTNGGGQFGFGGAALESPESGGLAGLTKAMLIESWMRGFRETPMKVIEVGELATPDSYVDGVLRELAVPSYDEETIVDGANRWTVRARYSPLDVKGRATPNITRGGTWIVSGGGRGITAMTAMALAERHQLNLVLLGTASVPNLSLETVARGIDNRSQLRRDMMLAAQAAGKNPIEAWRDAEKALEIEITLTECSRRGIAAIYESVDVSDAAAVSRLVDRVRHEHGPIRGIIHGAGAGQDARFDRKRPEKVEKCIRAKVDGCIALATATNSDPLEWFVGFGSISGRFGANGHTDYSLANDMLAKCVNRLSTDRPDVRCVTFHWHAWGDIGMAAKPEAKLALEMIGMQFMPAQDGLTHFLNELEYGGDVAEVLITDRNYVRKFFPDVERAARGKQRPLAPMLDPSGRALAQEQSSFVVTLDPTTDRFLTEHRVGNRPTLPFVIALEMMAEAALAGSGDSHVHKCIAARAMQAMKFASDDAMAVEVSSLGEPHRWSIRADLRRKDGRLVEEGRQFFAASFVTGPSREAAKVDLPLGRSWAFTPIEYQPASAMVYHGEPLQALREIAVVAGEAMGRIAAPSPAHLGGENRPLAGWVLPCAAMDAVLYAAAVLAYHEVGKPSLPVSFEEIHIGRLPDPGEPLWTHIRAAQSDASGMVMEADLVGQNGDLVLSLRGYRVNWIR